jgi:hypothetical protein
MESKMTVLSSKTFRSDADDFMRYIREYIDRFTGNGVIEIDVAIRRAGEARQRKKTATRQLGDLIADSPSELPLRFAEYGYEFNFLTRKFFWHGEEIHITANEALFLYRWVVLMDDNIRNVQRHFLRNMRRRLGKEFLAEVPHGAS